MSKLCSINGCNYPVFSRGLCKNHSPKSPIKKISPKGKIKKENKKLLIKKDFEFYLDIWENCYREYQNQYCFNCGVGLLEPLITQFHHLLPKRNYPSLRHIIDNIVILCPDCHSQVELDINKVPKIKQLTEDIKKQLL